MIKIHKNQVIHPKRLGEEAWDTTRSDKDIEFNEDETHISTYQRNKTLYRVYLYHEPYPKFKNNSIEAIWWVDK